MVTFLILISNSYQCALTSRSAFSTVNVLTAFWASDEMCLKGWSLYTCCTDPTADQGARGRSQSHGMTRPAFLRHPFAASNFTSSSPIADPAPSRGQLRRRIPHTPPTPYIPAISAEPLGKSAAVHCGNHVLFGISALPGTICPWTLTQKQLCQGGFPLPCCTLQATWARQGPEDRSIILQSGCQRRGLFTAPVILSDWVDIQWANKVTPRLLLPFSFMFN